MYVIWGETQGIPILSDASLVQPVDVDGAPIEIDAEGAPVDPTLAQKVKHARLNVGRAPTKLLNRRAEEVITLLNTATATSLNPAGRLALTVDGVEKTIDSPL